MNLKGFWSFVAGFIIELHYLAIFLHLLFIDKLIFYLCPIFHVTKYKNLICFFSIWNYLLGGLRESHDALRHQQSHSGSRNGAHRLQEVGPGPVVTSLAPATWPAQDDGVGLQTAQTNGLHPESIEKVCLIKYSYECWKVKLTCGSDPQQRRLRPSRRQSPWPFLLPLPFSNSAWWPTPLPHWTRNVLKIFHFKFKEGNKYSYL